MLLPVGHLPSCRDTTPSSSSGVSWTPAPTSPGPPSAPAPGWEYIFPYLWAPHSESCLSPCPLGDHVRTQAVSLRLMAQETALGRITNPLGQSSRSRRIGRDCHPPLPPPLGAGPPPPSLPDRATHSLTTLWLGSPRDSFHICSVFPARMGGNRAQRLKAQV